MTDLWEKCTRHMLLWSEDELDSFLHIIQKVSDNITSHPEDTKYQKLKFNNRLVNEKINARTGGVDFMLAMGFDVIEEEVTGAARGTGSEKMYVLRKDGLGSIAASVSWLSETVGVCKELIQRKKTASSSPSSCVYAASCLVQLKLPTGAAVQGGFMATDSIGDVKRFAQHFFREDRHSQVLLRLPHASSAALDPDPASAHTLSSLKLLPRCVLLASTLSEEDREGNFKQAHVQAVVHEAEKSAFKQNNKQTKKMEHEQRQKLKSDILRAFKEDHDTIEDSYYKTEQKQLDSGDKSGGVR